ncbi:MAG: CotH kinase family protein, partial [Planctomycetales bacterium]|nr:CotH kinase family protein [Planctomycetales bacterium]
VVYASGKDRITADAPLHTNFRLDNDGEFLALVQPNGTTIEHQYAPFGALLPDRAFGLAQSVESIALFEPTSPVRTMVPTSELAEAVTSGSWTMPEFDDATWISGAGGVGFEQATEFDPYIGTDIESQMFGVNSTALVRIPFDVANPYAITDMSFQLQYDDGFVAYLNGVKIAEANAPDELAWDTRSTGTHRDTLAVQFESFDATPFVHLLQPTNNILAIHGMNSGTSSDDFLIAAKLDAFQPGSLESLPPGYFAKATPGRPNGDIVYAGLVNDVQADKLRGFYDSAFDVQLTSGTAGATIVYTTDGSEPSLGNGIQIPPNRADEFVSSTVSISKTTTLRAAAFKDGFLTSKIMTQTYLMLSDVIQQDVQATVDAGFPETWGRYEPDYGVDPDVVGPNDQYNGEFAAQILDALKAAPTVSITTDINNLFGENGIYENSVRSGAEWERPISVEIMLPDGSNQIQVDAGLRIAGDNVRNFANSKKQSFRLEFRAEYGATKLRFPLYEDADAVDSFDTIILRGAYNDGWVHTPNTTQFIRDEWARTTLRMMGQPQVHGRFVHVYLNGFYWGVYNAVERPVASFASDYFGGDKDEWDALNTGSVRDGNGDAWADLRRIAREANTDDQQASNAAFQQLLGNHPDGTRNPQQQVILDVDNYIDYLIVNFYGGNTDWPGRNYYAARQQGSDSTGFKFFAWDTEKILDHGEGSTLTTNNLNVSDGVAVAYRYLLSNDEFRLRFADHIHRHFFNGGVLAVNPDSPAWDPENPQNNMPAQTYAAIADRIELALIAESARWGDTQSTSTRNDGRTYTVNDWRAKRDDLYEKYFPNRSQIVLNYFVRSKLYPEVAAPVFNQHGGSIDANFSLEMTSPGTIYYTLDGSDPRRSTLEPGVTEAGVRSTAIEYSGPITLPAGAIVKARTLVDGVWSALNEATFTVANNPIRIAEIMYNPSDRNTNGIDNDEFEFVELVNTSATETINLAGYRFTEGIEFTFGDVSLAPHQRTVVVANQTAFQQRYGSDLPVAGEYGTTPDTFRLSNSGETLRFVDSVGGIVHEVTYSDDWIASTDGAGASLTAITDLPNQDEAEISRWRASVSIGGSPGRTEQLDVNGDGESTIADVDLFCSALQANVTQYDLNGDNRLDIQDMALVIQSILRIPYGDANLDGRFDSADLALVFQAAEYEDEFVRNSRWSEGDWNCDGDFTARDIVDTFVFGEYSLPAAIATEQAAAHTVKIRNIAAALAVDMAFSTERSSLAIRR